MKPTTKISMLLLFAATLFSCTSEDKQLELTGKVLNPETKSILLTKPGQDLRFDSIIRIPVENGEFHYSAKLDYPEGVELMTGEDILDGQMAYSVVFLENEKINLTIYPEDEFKKNIVEGGKLNAEYKKYNDHMYSQYYDKADSIDNIIESLEEKGLYFSDTTKVIMAELEKVESREEQKQIYEKLDVLHELGLALTPEGKRLEDERDRIYKESFKQTQVYVKENSTLVSYYFFLRKLLSNGQKNDIDIAEARKDYKRFSDAHPKHPYNILAINSIDAIDNIKVGKKYVDFSAPDMDGKQIKLSDEIAGKVALLDLWATWCGSCIRHSREMIPVYNEFKDKGFTIVGVAGEFKSTDKLVKFMEKNKWAWLNLVELDRQNNIWQKYGVDNSGGGIFLIDKDGTIIAINPTAEEVRKELDKRLR
ncbi:MAG: redoxin domain-containing protein [Bacteroidales bacterium]